MNQPASLRFFKWIGIAEGISYLLLLGIAMPLKYFADMPEAVKYTGWAHGVLFVAYLIALLWVWNDCKWSFGKAVLAFIASLLPFGPFLFDRRYLRESQRPD